MHVSTLKRIIEALGGELEVIAKFPKGAVKIDQFAKPKHPAGFVRHGPGELQLI
jgi:hypothetical protein